MITKSIFFITLLSLALTPGKSQVGVGTNTPKSSLQVEGQPTQTSTADGIQGPTLSLAQLDAKVAAYGNDQDGAIVYIDDVTAASTETETANITTTGYYFYDATNDVWNAMKTTTYSVGDFAQGGIVFWVDETGQHGLVAAKEDQSTGVRWYAGTSGNTQAKGDGPYAGEANTAIIIAAQVAIGDDGSTNAGRICNELEVVQGGNNYGDWYLPSISELKLIYDKRSVINPTATSNGGTTLDESANANYWSSTETSDTNAEYQRFDNGEDNDGNKDQQFIVRAVRAF